MRHYISQLACNIARHIRLSRCYKRLFSRPGLFLDKYNLILIPSLVDSLTVRDEGIGNKVVH